MAMSLSFFVPSGTNDHRWSVKLCGVYPSATEATAAARSGVDAEPQGTMFLVNPVGTWVMCNPNADWYKNTEEVASKEHDNTAIGRHGSVCNIRRRQQTTTNDTPLPPASNTEKEQTRQTHHLRLRQLLQYNEARLSDTAAFSNLHHQYAMLAAYIRGLQEHLETASTAKMRATDAIRKLEEEYPEYRSQCRQRYMAALADSGIKMDEKDPTCVLHHLMQDD